MDETLKNQSPQLSSDLNHPAEGGCCGECQDCNLCENCRADKKQMVFDWMRDAPELVQECDYVEVQFKNTRKGYYLNNQHLELHKGDMVAVEGNPGHDIGEVTLTGYLVGLQMKKNNFRFDDPDAIRKVFRLAKPADLDRYKEAKAKEHDTMLRSRKIAEDLKLDMKIGDVEYQGDGNKAIFYYIADGRVDFRQLIKVLADAFHVRIEMKQIGARQEAGRIGGIGPCGRELCCAGWMTKFMSVGTGAARFQDLSLNPQKLAGQCAKLKCCLNYEVDCYMEAGRELPGRDVVLQTQDADYYLFKTDILGRRLTYSTSKDGPFNLVSISAQRAFEVISMNKRGQKADKLALVEEEEETSPEFSDGVGDEDLNRFDRRKKSKSRPARENRERRSEGTPRPPRQEGQQKPPRPAESAQEPRPQEPRPSEQTPRDNRNRPPRDNRNRERNPRNRERGNRPNNPNGQQAPAQPRPNNPNGQQATAQPSKESPKPAADN